MLLACVVVDELLSFVDGLLRSRDGILQHGVQWNALCRAFDLRYTSGDLPGIFMGLSSHASHKGE